MAVKEIKITETANQKTFEACLADQCPGEPDGEHIRQYHRSWTWSLDTPMTEEDMLREVKLLAAGEQARMSPEPPAVRTVSIEI